MLTMPCTRKGIPLRSIPAGDGHVVAGRSAPGNNRRVLPSAGREALRASQPADARVQINLNRWDSREAG